MSIGIFTKRAIHYQVQTPVYQGPLDLLLNLIEKAELDITQLALAQVTDQYLAYLQSLDHLETDEISFFIVVATKLLYLKSQMLLPKPVVDLEPEEEIGEELVKQLKEYKQFREIAALLGEREMRGLKTYLRLAPPPKVQGSIDLSDLDLQTFLLAAQNVFQNVQLSSDIHSTIIKPRYTIKEQIQKIVKLLQEQGKTTFQTLISPLRSRSEVITVFLALLELMKQHQIEIQQAKLFDDINVYPTPELFENNIVESEFED